MGDTEREVTREDIEALAAKLGPAVESLTDSEREVFDSILERAGTATDEVSGFAMKGGPFIKMGIPSVGWENPLSGQLASAAGMEAPGKGGMEKWT